MARPFGMQGSHNGSISLVGPQDQKVNGSVQVKPLSTFDHFIKNTSSALMKGKSTPTS
jgi:hypothetical protein